VGTHTADNGSTKVVCASRAFARFHSLLEAVTAPVTEASEWAS
jgi:hypothetical protein